MWFHLQLLFQWEEGVVDPVVKLQLWWEELQSLWLHPLLEMPFLKTERRVRITERLLKDYWGILSWVWYCRREGDDSRHKSI